MKEEGAAGITKEEMIAIVAEALEDILAPKLAKLAEGLTELEKSTAELEEYTARLLKMVCPSGRGEQRQRNAGCLCGCGFSPTRKESLFCQGHSIRMVELAKRYVRGEVRPDEGQMRYLRDSGKLDAAVDRVKLENAEWRRVVEKGRKMEDSGG